MPPDAWKDYTGVVYKDDTPYLMSLVTNTRNRSLILVPLTREVLANLIPGLGSVGVPDLASLDFSGKSHPFSGGFASYNNAVAGRVPPQSNVLDFEITGVAPIEIADWTRPNSQTSTTMVILTRLSAVLGVVFPSAVIESMTLFVAIFYVITALLGATLFVLVVYRRHDDTHHHGRRS